MKVLITAIVGGILLFNSGCASYMVMEGSKKRIAKRKYAQEVRRNPAIKAQVTEDGFMIGVDIANLEALQERPWLQLGAAILDGALGYGAYRAIDGMDGGSSGGRSGDEVNVTVTGNEGDTSVNINTGDQNERVNNSDQSSEYSGGEGF